MSVFVVVLVVLATVVVSSWAFRILASAFPLPIIQVVLGVAVGQLGFPRISVSPELFFLLFFAPVLFLDAWRTPRDALLDHGIAVGQLSIALVFFTVVGMGLAVHWTVPQMPLPVGFALAAALSPTDAVAVLAIAERCTFPRRILAVLKGEALLNDASGLVCLRFAIAAALAGSFSLAQAAASFTELVLGGVAVGFGTTWVIVMIKNVFASWFGEDVTNQILISLLIPFVVYIAADYAHVSGILAVVSAGLTMNYFELQGRALALTRVRREVVWGTIHSVLNGALFVLMGEQLVPVFRGAMQETQAIGYESPLWLVLWTILIGTTLWLLRFLWVFISLRITGFRGVKPSSQDAIENWRSIVAGTFGGVRGAMTFAAILTLPMSLPDGSAFPFRDLSICLAAGVIMMTLLTAALILPNILGHLGVAIDDTSDVQEMSARAVAAAAGIRVIEHTRIALIASGADDAAAERAAAPYRRRVIEHLQGGLGRRNRTVDEKIAIELESAALQAEREVIFQLQAAHAIDQETQRRLLREIDIAEIVMRDQRSFATSWQQGHD